MTTQELTQRCSNQGTRTEEEHTHYYQPATDVRETDEEVLLLLDMPGVSNDHIDLVVEKGTLTVTGQTDQEEQGEPVYRETRVGNYRRTFSLSDEVDTDHISAEMKAGVLTVRIPKPEKAKPRRIEIARA